MAPVKQKFSWKWSLAYGVYIPAGAYFGQLLWRLLRDKSLDELTSLSVIALYIASGIAIVLIRRLAS
ncbi:hypothetical protein [Photobacterium chitinilyticum]|uniref:Uncharacterized protein n=1 Tax=Photobacterium chitinilyticum TaxID=2485123 RepID=A0A3S4THR4_9GAMM|nr:hypothetical protein [Photobacterium chitinilyticum]RWX52882.1 hypothetical protein EDI28_24790 [Photobacterium chitinilyticum]